MTVIPMLSCHNSYLRGGMRKCIGNQETDDTLFSILQHRVQVAYYSTHNVDKFLRVLEEILKGKGLSVYERKHIITQLYNSLNNHANVDEVYNRTIVVLNQLRSGRSDVDYMYREMVRRGVKKVVDEVTTNITNKIVEKEGYTGWEKETEGWE